MAPSQTFTSFHSTSSNYGFGSTTPGGPVIGTPTNPAGMTFTLSEAGTGASYNMALYPFAIYVSNSVSSGTNSFTLTWDDGASGTQAQSIAILGLTGLGDVYFQTSGGGSVLAQKSGGTSGGRSTILHGSTYVGQVTGIKFVLSGFASHQGITSIKMTVNCFTKGTMISTDEGQRPVETLSAGDKIKTKDGREMPIKWVGQRKVETKFTDPAKVNPVRICADALGNGYPQRDLELSPDHAVEIDGVLINAGALVNGTTIHQVETMPKEGFTYYHVETDAHELLLAEGVAAETFIDYAGRDSFENGDDVTGQVAEMALPRISSARMVPSELQTRLNENKQSRSMA